MGERADRMHELAERIRAGQSLQQVPGFADEVKVRLDMADARFEALFETMAEASEAAGIAPAPERHLRLVRPGETA
jgi:hypothetical protein